MSAPAVPPADFAIYLTHLEIVGLLCAARAVIDSAPVGSPCEPLLDAERKLDDALARSK